MTERCKVKFRHTHLEFSDAHIDSVSLIYFITVPLLCSPLFLLGVESVAK